VSDDATELDALFEEVAAQCGRTVATVAPDARELEAAPEPEPAPPAGTVVPAPDVPMFDCLGGIVRQLHDALRELGYDRAIAEIVDQVSDSQNRLEYMAALTEQAANKVLNAVDEALPAQEAQATAARQLETRWAAMFAGELKVDAFKQLAHDSRDFASSTVCSSEAEKGRLMSIMMAQDFQDITGQIIKKVIDLTQQLEHDLAQLLRSYAPAAPREKPVDLLSGPGLPALAMVQDDVDNLLSELGF
jgi:chemotaxis protein CheZ